MEVHVHQSVSVFSGTLLTELASHTRLADIPDAELRRRRLVRLFEPVSRTTGVMTSADFGQLYARCVALLQRYEGYIFAHDLNKIRGFMARRNVIRLEDLRAVVARARIFQKSGIPPIFQEELYSRTTFKYFVPGKAHGMADEVRFPSLFPSIDFIIQYGGGTYERNTARMAARLTDHGIKGSKIPIKPSEVEDVRAFCAQAFTSEGKIDPLLIREIEAHVAAKFAHTDDRRRREIIEHDAPIFPFLEFVLRDVPVPRAAPAEWDGDPDVVLKRRWYLAYRSEDRERIAQAFLDRLMKPLDKGKRAAFDRLRVLFPERCEGVAEQLGLRRQQEDRRVLLERVERALASGVLKGIPQAVYAHPEWAHMLPRIEACFREVCRTVGETDPSALFTNVSEISRVLRAPSGLPVLPRFKQILDEERLAVLRRMDDARFRQVFGHKTWNGVLGYGHAKVHESGSSSLELRNEIQARYRRFRQA